MDENEKPGLDEPISPEIFEELLARPRRDLDEALALGQKERAAAIAEAKIPRIDGNLRFR